MLHSSLLVLQFIAVTVMVVYTSEGGAASVEVYCKNSTECSIGFTWLSPNAARERCITQGFGDSCRPRARKDYFTTVDEVPLSLITPKLRLF